MYLWVFHSGKERNNLHTILVPLIYIFDQITLVSFADRKLHYLIAETSTLSRRHVMKRIRLLVDLFHQISVPWQEKMSGRYFLNYISFFHVMRKVYLIETMRRK